MIIIPARGSITLKETHLSESGATIAEMAQAMVERKIDPDLEKNKRVTRLWLPKLGLKVKKVEDGRYVKA